MWCERTSQCYGDSDEGVTIHRMKKDKEVAYRGGDIGEELKNEMGGY